MWGGGYNADNSLKNGILPKILHRKEVKYLFILNLDYQHLTRFYDPIQPFSNQLYSVVVEGPLRVQGV